MLSYTTAGRETFLHLLSTDAETENSIVHAVEVEAVITKRAKWSPGGGERLGKVSARAGLLGQKGLIDLFPFGLSRDKVQRANTKQRLRTTERTTFEVAGQLVLIVSRTLLTPVSQAVGTEWMIAILQ